MEIHQELTIKMLTIDEIKKTYGHLASFAIWKKIDKTQKVKFGVGDISHFDELTESDINRNIILVGLNLSGKGYINNPFQNFHSHNPYAHDFKIRFAIEDTIFSGAYMTDIIKDYEEVMSSNVKKYLRANPEIKQQNIDLFKKEIEHIGSINPIIIAFGNDCFEILSKLKNEYTIFKVPHYSSRIKKEDLKDEFCKISQIIN